jgi:hypothetical protein
MYKKNGFQECFQVSRKLAEVLLPEGTIFDKNYLCIKPILGTF